MGAAGRQRKRKAPIFLVAAGRTPNTLDIGLEQAGIELDERGFIKVDDRSARMAARALARWQGEGGRVRVDVIPRPE